MRIKPVIKACRLAIPATVRELCGMTRYAARARRHAAPRRRMIFVRDIGIQRIALNADILKQSKQHQRKVAMRYTLS